MNLTKNPYKGSRDFFPKDKRVLNYLFDKMKIAAEKFGYEPYDGPLLEEVDLYKAKSGEELINDQIYDFVDRGKRHVAIRPEMTPTLARMVAQIHQETPKPIRYYAIPNLMRYEQPQKGRLREHWQFNCDIFGAPDNFGELEIIQIIISLLQSFNANHTHFEVLINNRKIVDFVFKNLLSCSDELSYKLYKIVDKSKKVSKEALQEMLNKTDLPASKFETFYEYLNLKNFNEVETFLAKNGFENPLKPFIEKMTHLKLNDYLTYDPTIVRGLDYYTGVVFEVFDKNPENRRAICGGGAYANLLQIFNEPALTGVGFGLGDVTLTDFLKTHKLLPDFSKQNPDIFITYLSESCSDFAMEVSQKIREFEGQNLQVVFHPLPVKPNKAFTLAENRGAKLIIIIGESEVAARRVSLKSLITKEKIDLEFNALETAPILKLIML